MRIVFVYPKFNKFLDDLPLRSREFAAPIVGQFTTPPSLGIPILCALTPPEHEVIVLDDNRGDSVDFDIDADLVAINCFTPQATRAFELAHGFRQAGKKVIMGGIFPTFMPDECLEYCDSVNIGEGEPTWHSILADVQSGELKRIYRGGTKFDLGNLPIPDRKAIYGKQGYDWHAALVQVARGCSYNCAMCSIPTHFGYRVRLRPVDAILREVKSLPYEQIYLADDTLFLPDRRTSAWAKELLKAMVPLKKRLFLASTLALNCEPDFLKLAADAGTETFYCTLNVDPVSMKALRGGDTLAEERVVDLVRRVEDLGMNFFASFGVGRDWDDEGIGERIVTLCQKAGIHTSEFFVFTAFPGSVQFNRMVSQKRLLHRNWSKYNGANVVFEPQQMSPERLEKIYHDIWVDFYQDQQRDVVLEQLGKTVTTSPHPDAGKIVTTDDRK